MFSRFAVDAHAADRIDRHASDLVAAAMLAAATGLRSGVVMVAGICRARAPWVIRLCHHRSPGLLKTIP
jgi:Mg2+/citrate symporter